MRTFIGVFLMVIGTGMVIAAAALYYSNVLEQQQAQRSVEQLMPQIVQAINEMPQQPVHCAEVEEMPAVEIEGNGYIGFLGLPSLYLELPVMQDWSYAKLKISPCRYYGDQNADNLVIMAHNYKLHFGRLGELRVGDTVTFTDMTGATTVYKVAALDVLPDTAIEEMTDGKYSLTLFTCNYSRSNRVAVRCDRVSRNTGNKT